MRIVLGPHPPPWEGVGKCAKKDLDENGDFLIGTGRVIIRTGELDVIRKRPFIIDFPRLLWRIRKKRKKIELISAHFATTFGFVAYISKKLYGIPYTVKCHGSDILINLDKFPHSWFTRKALENAEEVIVVSNAMKKKIEEKGIKNKVTVKHNTVDREKFKPLKTKKKNQIIFVGTVYERKGVDILLKAFAKIKDRIPSYNLVIVGRLVNTKYHLELKRIIYENDMVERVLFKGERSDIPELLNESKLFVLPSRMEGYGIALEEALACKVPSIASNIGGIPEVVKKGDDCTFVEPGNVEELAEKIQEKIGG